jgi:hypothetical protein
MTGKKLSPSTPPESRGSFEILIFAEVFNQSEIRKIKRK